MWLICLFWFAVHHILSPSTSQRLAFWRVSKALLDSTWLWGKKKKQLITLFSCHLWKYGLILVSPLILSPLWSGRWAAMYHLFGNHQAWVRFHPSGPAKLKRTPHITHFLGISTKSPLFFGACMLSRFSRVRLFVTLWTVAHQDPLSMDFSRQECWSGLPCPPPGDLPNPGIEPASLLSPALAGGFFTYCLQTPILY